MAKARAGTHSTRTISGVSGTTKKPYKQKGTGNARQGSLRSVQFRGGGVIFGPIPRDHSWKMPRKARKAALRSMVASKCLDNDLVVMDDFNLTDHKTRSLKTLLDKIGMNSVLFVGSESDMNNNLRYASSNLQNVDILPCSALNVLDVIKHDVLCLSRSAVSYIEGMLQ
jgi:large subunit ribosomal protein L4